MPIGRETASFCPQHIEVVQGISRLEAQQEEVLRDQAREAVKVSALEQKTSKLEGYYEGAVPKVQKDTETIFRLLGEREEQSQLYHGQTRALAQKVQDIGDDVTHGLDRKADKQYVQDEIKNVYRWVTVGFVGWGLTILAFALYIVLAKLGVKGP
jgi:hypothetical protein